MAVRRQDKEKRNNKNKFTMRMQKKLVVLVVAVVLAFAALSVRLYLLVRDHGDSYKRQVLSQQEYSSTTIPFKRGNIVDCNGTILATSRKVYNLIIDSKEILSDEDYMEPTLAALDSCFDVDIAALRQYINDHPNSQYYVLLRRMPYEDISAFKEIQNNSTEYPNVAGVWFEEEYQRNYPNGSLACDIIGFTGNDNTGMYGLEQYYNEELCGMNGREYGYLNEDSDLERTTVPAQDGYTLVSTIDAHIQSIVERKLREFNDAHEDEYRDGLGAYNTGCIIMNPNNGEILAMASYPTFDCNNPYDISALYTEEEIDAMTQEEYTEIVNQLWQNFCISSTYEPGSTMKPFTVATGLETGALTGNEHYMCNGYLTVADYDIHCHNRMGHGEVTVQGAMESSCNVALMHMGAAVGKTNMLKYEAIFNFGLRTNIDLAGETRTDALVYTEKTMHETELATSSFGQGFNVTMIQLMTAYCSLINGGYYYEPHMVSRILNADGATVRNIEPRILKQTISTAVSDTIVRYCNAVVETGTGSAARPAGYTMGGKTGTAEVVPRDGINYVVSFIGYVPANDPQVAIYVVIDRANQYKQDNSRLASGIVREILTEVLPYLGIPMTEELTDAERAELDNLEMNSITIPTPSVDPNDDDGLSGGDGTGDGGQTGTAGGDGLSGGTGDGGTGHTVRYDPDTGYAIDPLTGEFLDPETGEPIEPGSPLVSPHQ
ncbi:MAG: cell division protein FtsI [Lachnospiraceae bacterium]|nr:cell division protein FtsI [Lachnospiraceae bacterium]